MASDFNVGSAVVDGNLRYISVSQIESFDPAVYGGCNRRWWFRRVKKAKEEQTKASAMGEQIHEQIEHYLRHGDESVLGPIAKSGLRFLPKPGSDLRLEWSFGEGSPSTPITSPLVLAGVPLIGKIDCAHARGEWIDDEGYLHKEPSTCVVVDWKSTSRIFDETDTDGVVTRAGLAKSADDLANMHQMRAYAALAAATWPEKKRIVLAHGYFQTQWPRVAATRIKIVDAAGARSRFEADTPLVEQMKVAAAAKVVTDLEPNLAACGAYRGCPHKDQCPRSPAGLLSSLFSTRNAPSGSKEKAPMSLMEKRKQERAAAAGSIAEDVKVEIAKLEAEEAGIGAPDAPPPQDTAKVSETATTFGGAPGEPCSMGGQQAKIEDGVKSYSCGCGATVRVRPKKLGDGTYALIPSHVVGETKAAAAPKTKKEAPLLVGPAGTSVLIYDPAAVVSDTAQDELLSSEEFKKLSSVVSRARDITAVDLYLDSAEDGVPTQRLEAYVENLAAELATSQGAIDIRCAPEKSSLAFGKYKGALAALVRENPPKPGAYAVSTTSELGMIAFEALASRGLGRVVRSAK